jgi:hypothetical protein
MLAVSMDVVTIATYAKPEEAHLARLRLCREDIPAFVIGEAVVQLNWAWTILVGGVRLQVAEDDAENARRVLRAEPVVMEGPNSSVLCPHCAGEDVEVYFKARRLGVLSLFLHFPFFFFTRWHRWKCAKCGRTWR